MGKRGKPHTIPQPTIDAIRRALTARRHTGRGWKPTQDEIARAHGVSQSTVSMIANMAGPYVHR